MKESTSKILEELVIKYLQLNYLNKDISKAYLILEGAYKNDKKVLICGNGGSASDSEHIVGELMKKFKKPRKINSEEYEKLSEYGEEGQKLQRTLEGDMLQVLCKP